MKSEPQEQYEKKVLFSLQYGAGENQVSFHLFKKTPEKDFLSIPGLSVPSEDIIFFVDPIQQRIKHFNALGDLITCTDYGQNVAGSKESSLNIGAVTSIVAMPTGHFCVLSDQGSIEIFDRTGSIRKFFNISKVKMDHNQGVDLPENLRFNFKAEAISGSEKIAAEIKTIRFPSPSTPYIPMAYADDRGNLYLDVAPVDNEVGAQLMRFDNDLNYLQSLPGFLVGWNGKPFTFGATKTRKAPPCEATVYSIDGRIESRFLLRPPQDISVHDFDQEKLAWIGILYYFMDAQNNIYVIKYQQRDKDKVTIIRDGMTITRDVNVYKFDKTGKFISKHTIIGSPFLVEPPVSIDPDGNIYYFNFEKDGVKIMKESVVSVK